MKSNLIYFIVLDLIYIVDVSGLGFNPSHPSLWRSRVRDINQLEIIKEA